ncbi:hypothetical protein OSK74_21160, partial [Escherichia coli]|nr:hypothetical protein [Escherichia coli]
MTVSKRGRVPKTIKEAVQEQFSRMGESYYANIKWAKSVKEGANKRGNSSRLTQSFHFFMFEPIF